VGIILAVIGAFVVMAILLSLVAFWLIAVGTMAAFMIGGVALMAIFGGGQDAFYIGGFFSVVIAWAVLAVIGSQSKRQEE
jgi:hypothetical protein